ncbi:MAG: hypothetical protein IJ630_11480 [Treponema sp.]|nr:hypothetical protein [Treponema sp.]
MKKSLKLLVAGLLAAGALFSLSAAEKEIKRNLKAAEGWNLYIPGKGNKKDVLKDLNKAGWQVSNNYKTHFSLVDGSINKKKVLKINTLDGKNDALMLPLTGKEKKVTLVFRAQGAVDPDNPQTPYGIFFAYLQNGIYQSMLRHNASNQLKGSKSMVRLTSDGTSKGKKLNIVSDWHEYRFVWDIEAEDKMTAQCYIDGKLFHSDTCKKVNFADTMKELDWNTMEGPGHYLEFGENDGSTNGFGRYAYLLVVIDEDISSVSTAELGKKLKVDLTSNPVTKDPGPQSRRPAKKPAGINIKGSEVGKSGDWDDPATIENGTLNLDEVQTSWTKIEKVVRNPATPDVKFAATVDASGANGAYKTIAEAIEKVPANSAIKIMPGTYQEKLLITKPGISLIGTDPAKTIIYGYEADTGGINGNLLVEVNLLPQGTNTEPGAAAVIPEKPVENCYFNAVNITFYNKGAEWNKLWGGSERRSIALAIKGVDKCYIDNCVFLGQQDTLYFRSGRIYMKNSYVEGDVDYICGGATCVFDNCHIFSLRYNNGAIIVAAAGADTGYASTAQYANGYVFKDCIIEGHTDLEDNPDGKQVTLARGTWVGGSATGESAVGKTVYLNCKVSKAVNTSPWKDWDAVNTAEKAFFRIQNMSGEGAANIKGAKTLSADEVKLYGNIESVLGFKPSL